MFALNAIAMQAKLGSSLVVATAAAAVVVRVILP